MYLLFLKIQTLETRSFCARTVFQETEEVKFCIEVVLIKLVGWNALNECIGSGDFRK